MFASQTTKTVTINGTTGHADVTIVRLNWLEQRAAMKARADEVAREASVLGPGQVRDLIRREMERTDLPAPTPEQLREMRYAAYDRRMVLRAGVKAWSGVIDGVDLKDQTLPDATDGLEEAKADRLHREILDLTLPAIDAPAREADRKKD